MSTGSTNHARSTKTTWWGLSRIKTLASSKRRWQRTLWRRSIWTSLQIVQSVWWRSWLPAGFLSSFAMSTISSMRTVSKCGLAQTRKETELQHAQCVELPSMNPRLKRKTTKELSQRSRIRRSELLGIRRLSLKTRRRLRSMTCLEGVKLVAIATSMSQKLWSVLQILKSTLIRKKRTTIKWTGTSKSTLK